jgi:hypothetical protein
LLSEPGNRWVGDKEQCVRHSHLPDIYKTTAYCPHLRRITRTTISTPITLLSRMLCCRTVHMRHIEHHNIHKSRVNIKNSNLRTLWSFWWPGSFFLTHDAIVTSMSHHVNHAVAEAQACQTVSTQSRQTSSSSTSQNL